MQLFCSIVVALSCIGIAEPNKEIGNEEVTDFQKLCTNLEKRIIALEMAKTALADDTKLEERVRALERQRLAPSSSLLQNDTNLEERVQALEFQMENVHEDMTVIEGEISVINSEQDLQDTQLQIIEEDVQGIGTDVESITGTVNELTATIDDLQATVVSLQETDAELMEDITQLTEADSSLDSRLSELEVDNTFAFHVVLGNYTTIPGESVIIYPIVNVNLGNGYNADTGDFTVPPGADGLYFFYAHFQLDVGKSAQIDIRHNGARLCTMAEDESIGGDFPGSSCAATVLLQQSA